MSRKAIPPPPEHPRPVPGVPSRHRWRNWLWPVVVLVVYAAAVSLPVLMEHSVTRELTYSDFLTAVDEHRVRTVVLHPGGDASGTLSDDTRFTTTVPAQAGPPLLDRLTAARATITATGSSGSAALEYVVWGLFLVPVLALLWMSRNGSSGGSGSLGGARGAGRSRAKLFDSERPDTAFADVAGYPGVKAEIGEVVDFLRRPERYRRAGATAPRGVLMVGPPGTGKTLLARAVAGEAEVPFFSVAGSSFVEMYVGVGAARVRDLFAEARKRAPAIVFVDEIDALGGRRGGSGALLSNDERDQTLNQLLSEMDGFDPGAGVVVLAATNRPDVLDPALLRPGRFDRHVTIPLPTHPERTAILRVHCRDKQLADEVDLPLVARLTPGFSGADLANLANEAAINAVRDDRVVLCARDFDTARDRILLGRRESSNMLLPEEKHAVAVHEAGHALVAALCPRADPVAKVTILPAGQSLGATEQLPLEERHLLGQDYLDDSLAVHLGGRAAELLVLGQGYSGAGHDLGRATELATRMVREYGLSPELGPVGYPAGGSAWTAGDAVEPGRRPYAEATQARIDDEVGRLVREAGARAAALLSGHRPELDELVGLLLERETVEGAEVHRLVRGPARCAEQPVGAR